MSCRLLEGQRGIFTAEALKDAIRGDNVHFARPALVCIENTHNRGGGSVWPVEQIRQVAQVASDAGMAMHMDGARLWNAAVASDVSERLYAEPFDSLSVCFSKGLGAPVGSALAGSAEFIARARRIRKRFGGGMRQGGILAAGALYALEHHRARLADDHRNAKTLAVGLADIDGIEVDLDGVQTNIVVFKLAKLPAAPFTDRLANAGVAMLPRDADSVRAVTNLMVNADQITQAIAIARNVMAKA